jgi:hypothetical protein
MHTFPNNQRGLADEIARAILSEPKPPQQAAAACFACGRSYAYCRPSGDDSGWFCSDRRR